MLLSTRGKHLCHDSQEEADMKIRYRAYSNGSALYGQSSEDEFRRRGLLSPDAELVFVIEANTPEEAMAIHQLRMGFGAFLPMGDPEPCPKCGTIYYPEASSVCWHCGPVGYETCRTTLSLPSEHEVLDSLHGRFRYRAYLDQSGNARLYSQDEEEDARAKGQITPDALPLWEIEVDTPEEAMTIYRLRMGLEPYTPKGDDGKCPKCGAVYYPEDSGVCWRCGPVR